MALQVRVSAEDMDSKALSSAVTKFSAKFCNVSCKQPFNSTLLSSYIGKYLFIYFLKGKWKTIVCVVTNLSNRRSSIVDSILKYCNGIENHKYLTISLGELWFEYTLNWMRYTIKL